MQALQLSFPLSPIPKKPHHYQICAWCQRIIDVLAHTSENDSYGICPDCATTYFSNLYNETPAPERKDSELIKETPFAHECELLAFELAA